MVQGNAKGGGRNDSGGTNRLVGWLVSYQMDERGAAFEIRAGRSFLTSKELPEGKVIAVTDATISSPHMALSANAKHRVVIQDIFSQYGSFITRSGTREEVPVAGPTEIEHGDWIRVGEKTRFQVCMIDGGSR